MSPLNLINHSQSRVEHAIASIGGQSSGSAYFAGFDSTVPGQVKSMPLPVRFLPVGKPAEPGVQLFFDRTRCVELVELPPCNITGNQLMSRFRLSTHRRMVGQQPGLILNNELHDHNLSVAPTLTYLEVRGEDKDCKSNCSTTPRDDKRKKCRRNRKERNRLALLDFAYEMLRSRIPPDYLPCRKKRLSRLKILTLATRYIVDLRELLAQEEDFVREKRTSPAGVSQQCQSGSTSVD